MSEFSFDFHFHSCLSPCGSSDMTPADIAGMCALLGYDIIALTDHNTVGNCAAFCKAAQHYGILALPGMELTTAEEVHVVCLFPDLDKASAFGDYVYRHLPPSRNQPDIFGHQVFMDEEDNILGEECALLIGATDIPVHKVHDLVSHFGGICFPAHIDRDSFSLLSNLGLWMPEAKFTYAELSRRCPPGFTGRRDLAEVRFLTGCDAHQLQDIPAPNQTISLPQLSAQAVIHAFSASV